MSAQSSELFDELGPRGRRNVRIGTILGSVAVAFLIGMALLQLNNSGQLEAERWGILFDFDSGVPQGLVRALGATLKAAIVAMLFSIVLGAVLATGRLSEHRWTRLPVVLVIEFFRGVPLLLLILFAWLALPKLGLNLNLYWTLVASLVAYNMAVLAEIFRAGILSIDRGQGEAGYAIGLRKYQVMILILVPQATRRMLPTIVSQLVTLLKDTSLGFIIGYFELLRAGRSFVEFYTSKFGLPIYVAVALFYIAVNLALSMFARYLDRRTSHSKKSATQEQDPGEPTGTNPKMAGFGE